VESSFDLMINSLFSITPRKSWMIPTPFVLNDAVIIRQKVKATPKSPDAKPAFRIKTQKDSLTVVVDSIR
jgi:hypothetical protein